LIAYGTGWESSVQTLDPDKSLEGEEEMAKVWADRGRSSPAPEVYEKSLAEEWRKTACAPDGAPYVLRGLPHKFNNPEFLGFGILPNLAATLLDKDCAGARGLSDAEIASLKAIRDGASPPAPKP
jgi:hypothetical protein